VPAPFDAFVAELERLAQRDTPAQPTSGDILAVYGAERRPYASAARDLLGLGAPARLPRRGTARRSEYERVRRELSAMGRGTRPSAALSRRLTRSPRIRAAVLTRRMSLVLTRLRQMGGGVAVEGDVEMFGYPETRTLPARGLQPMGPDAWGRIIGALGTGDPAMFAAALSVEFSNSYMGPSAQLTDLQRGTTETAVTLLDISLTVEPGGAP
jgi:hypothetical protein